MGSTCTCTCDSDGNDQKSKAKKNMDDRGTGMTPSPKGIKGRKPSKSSKRRNKMNTSNTVKIQTQNQNNNNNKPLIDANPQATSMYANDEMPLLSIEADARYPELPQDNEGQGQEQMTTNHVDGDDLGDENGIFGLIMHQDTLNMIQNMPNLTPVPSNNPSDIQSQASSFPDIPTQPQQPHIVYENEQDYDQTYNGDVHEKQENTPNITVSPMNMADQDQNALLPKVNINQGLPNLGIKAVMIDKYGLSYSVSDDSSVDENEREEIERRRSERRLSGADINNTTDNTDNNKHKRKDSGSKLLNLSLNKSMTPTKNLVSPAHVNDGWGSDVMDEMEDDMKAEMKSLVDQGMSLQSGNSSLMTPNYQINIYGNNNNTTDEDIGIDNDDDNNNNNNYLGAAPPRNLIRPKSVDKWDTDVIDQQRDDMAKAMMHLVQNSNHLSLEDIPAQTVNFDEDEDQ